MSRSKSGVETIISVLVTLLLLFCFSASAQTDRGSITGTVTDPSGSVVGGVTVTLFSTETGSKTFAHTTAAGIYSFPQVPPSTYQIEAEATGFKKAVVRELRVGVLQKLEVNLTLELGSVADSVTVTGISELLTPTSAAIGTNIAPREYQDLPVFFGGGFRTPYGLAALLPGVNNTKFGMHISGGQANSRELQVDGVSVSMAEWQGDSRGFQVPSDTIQEFSIITNNFAAEFGRSGGGVESYTVKSGTNEYHGQLYEYTRNDAVDARAFYAARVGIYKQHDFGGNVGGPVIIPKLYNGKNKTFFFFHNSYYRQANANNSYLSSVPTAKMKNGEFTEFVDTKGAVINIYDPNTTRTDSTGVLVRDPFVGNAIPKARFSKVASNVQAYFPEATRTGYFNNFDSYDRGDNRQTDFTGKLEHNLGSNHKLGVSIVSTIWPQIGARGLPYPINGKQNTYLDSWVGRATYDWIVTPSMVNHLALGYNRYIVQTAGISNGKDWYSELGYSGAKAGAVWGFPSLNLGGNIGAIGGGGGFATFDNTYNVLDSFSWARGKHNIKFGFEIRKMQNNSVNPGNGPSTVYTQGATALPNAASQSFTGNSYASFLLGDAYQVGMFINDITNGPRWAQYMTYVQDDWKVSSRLTLNLGLRYEVPKPFYDVNLASSTIDMTKPNPAAGNLPGTLIFAPDWYKQTGNKSFMDTSWHEFGPRVGLAYRLDQNTVIRTAYGIFYNAGFGLGNGFRGSTAGYSVNSTAAAPNPWEYKWNIDTPYTIDFQMPPFTSPSFGVESSSSFSAITRDLGKSAYIQTWNFGLQRQLKGNIVLEADYVGNKGTRLPSLRFQGKQLQPWYWGLGGLLTKNIRDPAVAAAGFQPPYSTFRSTTLARALGLLPQYDRFTPNVADGMSTYESVQFKLQKRFSSGSSFLGSYTLGKMITDTSSQLQRTAYGSVNARDSWNKSVDKALAPDDRTHVLTVSFLYELPFGPNKPWLKFKGPAQYIFGGWQVNGVLSYASGYPLTIGGNYNLIPDTGIGANRTVTPNAVAGATRGNTITGKWVPGVASNTSIGSVYANLAAWSQVQGYNIGTSPYVLPDLRGFSSKNENLSIFKSFSVKERINFQIKGEASNIFNRFIPSDPNMGWNPANVQWGKTYGQANGPRVIQVGAKMTF